jgi:1-acyl-sn-glycerol-3-phosphate acyltransferase
VGIINRWWAYTFFFLLGYIPRIELRKKLNHNHQYIFCPNHFSYFDIPAMGLNPHNCIFVGKSAMEKIPLFGFMYTRLHITVDRSKLKSRYTTLIRSLQAIDEGKSLVIFPEGGMVTHRPPHMGRFKDGAFRCAIEKQIPIVPVTIPYNWIILPDEKKLRLRWHQLKLIFHEPIDTRGLTLKDLDSLKDQVYQIIDTELKHQLNHEHRPDHT